MQNLEKILEEIKQEQEKRMDELKVEIRPLEILMNREQYKGLCVAEKIIRKHMSNDWIPVKERRPEEEYCTVLCVTDKNYYCVAVYNEKYGFRTGDINVEGAIIAWRPLPDLYRPESLETRKELEEDSKGERENERD